MHSHELRSNAKRLATLLLAVALALTMMVPPGASAFAAESSKSVTRIAGNTAEETSAEISKSAFPSGVGSRCAIVARSDDFADAMSAAGLAGTLDCPIVTTSPNEPSSAMLNEIKRLGVKSVYIIGGPVAISDGVKSALEGMGIKVERIFGQNAWDTSVECAKVIKSKGGNPKGDTIVATSHNFQDALSISSFAFKYKVPIILENANFGLTDEAKDIVSATSGKVYVPGGLVVVPRSSAEDIVGDGKVVRLAGNSGYDTSNQIATYLTQHNLLDKGSVFVATGALATKGVDALSGAVFAGKNSAPVVLVSANSAIEPEDATVIDGRDSQGKQGFISANAGSLRNAYILGGTSVVPERYKTAISRIINGVDDPWDSANQSNSDSISYASGVKTVKDNWSMTNGSEVKVSSSASNAKVGDVVVFEPTDENPMGYAMKVSNVSVSGSNVVYSGSVPEASEVIDKLAAEGTTETGMIFEPAQGVTVKDSGLSTFSTIKNEKKLTQVSLELDDYNTTISFTPSFQYKIDFSHGKLNELSLALKSKASISCDISAKNSLSHDLCDIYVPTGVPALWFKAAITFKMSVSGGIELSISNTTTVGFSIKDGSVDPTFKNKSNEIDVDVSAEFKSTIGANAGITLFGRINLAKAGLDFGAKLKAGDVAVRDNGLVCSDLKSSAFSAIDLTIGDGPLKTKFKQDLADIPIDTAHFENGNWVPKCTWNSSGGAAEGGGIRGDFTPASDFKYIIGNPTEDLKIQGAEITYWNRGYGYTYGSHGEGGDGFDCGYGVYITDYIGNDDRIVIPDKIEGVNVVCVDICDGGKYNDGESYDMPTKNRTIDVSSSTTLKALTVWNMQLYKNTLIFGSNPNLKNLFFGICVLGDLNVSSLTGLEDLCFAQGVIYDSLNMGSNAGKERQYSVPEEIF